MSQWNTVEYHQQFVFHHHQIFFSSFFFLGFHFPFYCYADDATSHDKISWQIDLLLILNFHLHNNFQIARWKFSFLFFLLNLFASFAFHFVQLLFGWGFVCANVSTLIIYFGLHKTPAHKSVHRKELCCCCVCVFFFVRSSFWVGRKHEICFTFFTFLTIVNLNLYNGQCVWIGVCIWKVFFLPLQITWNHSVPIYFGNVKIIRKNQHSLREWFHHLFNSTAKSYSKTSRKVVWLWQRKKKRFQPVSFQLWKSKLAGPIFPFIQTIPVRELTERWKKGRKTASVSIKLPFVCVQSTDESNGFTVIVRESVFVSFLLCFVRFLHHY